MAPKRSASDKRSRKPLTLKQKLEMIELREKGMSKAEISRKLGLARQTAQ
jgi:IS30 family transposase